MRWWLWVLVAVAGMLAGCKQGERNGELWQEKVEVQTGETIIVEREHLFEGGRGGGPLLWARMEFDYRGKHYRWAEEAVWPILLQIDEQGRPVVASAIGYEWAWHHRGKPCDFGVLQVFADGVWRQEPSWEIWVSRTSNLAMNSERAARGESMSKSMWSMHKEFDSTKNTCLEGGGGDVF